jgi:trehalose 6-phosphate synthase/phosphatase
MAVGRLLIVSNRLPVSVRIAADGPHLIPASGGLARGLAPWHERCDSLWIGWPGDLARTSSHQRSRVDAHLRKRGIVAVDLSRAQIDRYYHGFANRVLWPLFHYLIDRVPVDASGWDAYREVNQRFADVVAREYRFGDTIWVHDYQLMLVPALLRDQLPHVRIGFFLHVPFPSSEVFRILPWRREILNGLLGADLVGFHTSAYMRHFLASLLHVDGVEPEVDRVRVGQRDVRLGVFPMGIDAVAFGRLARDPGVIDDAAAVRREAGERQILLGVDRLDYTKGIPRRLEAVHRLLQNRPDLRDRIRYIQIAVPSRGEVDSYERFKRHLEETVGRINGACGTLHSTPVHYVHRSVSMRELAALYCAADVMLVTPLRDGMNLVSKEFVAAREDEDGVLILSEFTGAAAELDGALVVNPYDIDAVAACIERALTMPVAERKGRMRSMRRRVAAQTSDVWAETFLGQLASVPEGEGAPVRLSAHRSLWELVPRASRQRPVRLLLDYDGTLVPLARMPDLAAPDEDLLGLLGELATAPWIQLEIVSGRPRDTLQRWLGHLHVTLWAEHGFWHRPHPEGAWEAAVNHPQDWTARIMPMLQQFTASTPGSHIEIKDASVAWHYRLAQEEFGTRQAHELRMLLGDVLSNQPLEVLEGKKVIEVRLRGVSKAVVARSRTAPETECTSIAFGDDRTDECLFAALPSSSVTIAVGNRLAGARYIVADHHAVRRLLRSLTLGATPNLLGIVPEPNPT